MTKFKAAVVQMGPVPFDKEATLEKVIGLMHEAASQGAKLVVFPEATISGYPKGSDFGARVGGRLPRGREEFLRYFKGAISIPGPEVDRLCEAASNAGVYVVIGVMEKELGTQYCTSVHISPTDGLMGKHRKLMPTAMERLVWGSGDGSTMPVHDTSIGKLGTVICWENYMPLFRTYMYSKGVQLYCAPTADDRDKWLSSMQHVALEGRCFVFSACQYITRGDFFDEYDAIQGNEPDVVLMRGGSAIINPFGEVIAGPVFEEEAILYADIDLEDITRGNYELDAVGHYSRPDIFTLVVDEREKKNVVNHEEARKIGLID